MEGFSSEEYYYRTGRNVRMKRQEKGMTQEELAEAAGLSLKMIQKLEGGQKGFRIDTIIRVAEILDISVDGLIGIQKSDEKTLFCQKAFYVLVKDNSIDEIKYAVGIVESVFRLHKQYLG